MESSASTWLPAVVHRPSIHCDSEFPLEFLTKVKRLKAKTEAWKFERKGHFCLSEDGWEGWKELLRYLWIHQDSCNDRQQFEATACLLILLAASHNSMDLWIWRDILGSVKFGCVCFGAWHGLFFSAWWIRNDPNNFPFFNLSQMWCLILSDQAGRIPSSWRQRSKAFRHAIREARLASSLECLSLASKGFPFRQKTEASPMSPCEWPCYGRRMCVSMGSFSVHVYMGCALIV